MKKYLILTALALFIYAGDSPAQLRILLGPTIGLTSPASDYSGETTDYYDGTGYGLHSSINFGAMGKLTLGPINLKLSLIYSPLRNDGVADRTHPNSTVEIKHNLFTIAVGPEYGFKIPAAPIRPYVGFDLLFTSISGETKFQGTSNVQSSNIDLSTATRTGLGFAAGAELKLMIMTLDLSIRYNLINLFSKQYEGSATGTRDEAYKFLNDDKDPNYLATDEKHPIGSSRTISTIQIQLGVLFGF